MEALTEDRVMQFLVTLRPYLAVPVKDKLWTDTKLVDEGASAPRARGGDIRNLAEHLAEWARAGNLPTKAAA